MSGYVGAFNPVSWKITYALRNEFTEFIQETIKKNPNTQLRCVLNSGIEKIIIDKIEYDKKSLSARSKEAER